MDNARDTLALGGRFLLGLIFLTSGLSKIGGWHAAAGFMAAKGMPAVGLLLTLAIIIEVLGSLSVITGFLARWGALGLAVYLVPVTLVFHNFWALSGAGRQMQMVNFMKNLSIIGGLLVVAALGAGAYSFDAFLQRRRALRGGGALPVAEGAQ